MSRGTFAERRQAELDQLASLQELQKRCLERLADLEREEAHAQGKLALGVAPENVVAVDAARKLLEANGFRVTKPNESEG